VIFIKETVDLLNFLSYDKCNFNIYTIKLNSFLFISMLAIDLNCLVLERRKKLYFIQLFHEIKELNQHKLNHKYFKLFCIKSKLSVSILIIISYSIKSHISHHIWILVLLRIFPLQFIF